MTTSKWWGISGHWDIKGADSQIVLNGDKLKTWLENLIVEIQMKQHGDVQIHHFGEFGTELEGWTATALLTTSSISVHACDLTRDLYLDVFTCKCLPNLQYLVEQYIMHTLNPVHITGSLLYRKA